MNNQGFCFTEKIIIKMKALFSSGPPTRLQSRKGLLSILLMKQSDASPKIHEENAYQNSKERNARHPLCLEAKLPLTRSQVLKLNFHKALGK